MLGRIPRNKEERIKHFWSRVNIIGLLDCWLWTGSTNPSGYGTIRGNNDKEYTHRFAWEATYGPVPDDKHILHKCDNPPCCNPDHLYIGTHQDNMADRNRRGRHLLCGGGKKGDEHYASVLSGDDVKRIRKLLEGGAIQARLAERFCVNFRTISAIKCGKIWTHI